MKGIVNYLLHRCDPKVPEDCNDDYMYIINNSFCVMIVIEMQS